MSDFKLFVRYKGNKEASANLRRKLEARDFDDSFISCLMNSRKATDVTHYLQEMTRLGVIFGDKNDILSDLVVRAKSAENDQYVTSPYKYDNVLKQIVISDPESFRSIAKRSAVRGNLNLLQKYEKANKKPFYTFSKQEAEKVVGNLSKGNRTPITIKSIVQNASVIEKKISDYVKAYDTNGEDSRIFTNVWSNVTLNDITGETNRKFLTRNNLTKLINRHVFYERNPQYTGLALLAFKGVRIDKNPEHNEMALIRVDDIDQAAKTIEVGIDDYRRKIKIDDNEWEVVQRMLNTHEPEKGIYLFQPFKTTRNADQPLTRWSLVQRLHDLSEEIYDDPNIAEYKALRLSGLNYIFAKALMDNGIMVSKNMRNPIIKDLAIECLKQFGDLPTTNMQKMRKPTVKTKIDRLKLNAIQYTESF